jgi:glycosyltransferase involved in cell wall biosynthesis
MRILMLNYEYPPLGGGASPVTKSLAEELVTLGHAVDVVTMSFKGLKQREEINGVNIYRVPGIRKSLSVCKTHEMFSYCLYTRRLLPKLLKENNYDLNHTHFIIPTGILSYRLKNKLPYIITSHGSDVPHYNPDRFGLSHRLLKPLWNKIVENAEYIITPSDYLKNIILTNSVFGRECSCSDRNYRKIEVIPNGIEPEEYHFEPHRKQKKILVVSRLFERKGVQYVIEAMKYIEGHTLVICGDGPYKEHLERQIKKFGLDNIHLLGWVNDERLRYEYETASIFVFPSSAESFGIVLLEAMLSGCAIVTTNNTGCAEVVADTALLVRSKNTGDIKKALLRLINDDELRSKLGEMARRRAEEKYTWKSIAQQYIEIYKSVVENEAGGNAW